MLTHECSYFLFFLRKEALKDFPPGTGALSNIQTTSIAVCDLFCGLTKFKEIVTTNWAKIKMSDDIRPAVFMAKVLSCSSF